MHMPCCSCVLPVVAGSTHMHITVHVLTSFSPKGYDPLLGQHNLTSVHMHVFMPHFSNEMNSYMALV